MRASSPYPNNLKQPKNPTSDSVSKTRLRQAPNFCPFPPSLFPFIQSYSFLPRCPRNINVRISRVLLYPIIANMSPTAKSPVGPTPPLPGSVEQSYRQKCIDLKKRINEIESSNDVLVVRIQRARRGIQRMRLERAFLLQQLEQRTDPRVEDSEGSPSPPPTV